LAAITGLAAGILFAVGNAIWGLDMPKDGAPVAEVLSFYDETADRIVIGGSISLISIGLFAVFAAAFREVLVERGVDAALANVVLVGGAMGAAIGVGAEGINLMAALRAQDGDLTPALGQSLFEISQFFGSAGAGIAMGVFAVATGAATWRTPGVLPRWVAAFCIVVGLVLLTPLAHINVVAGIALIVLSIEIPLQLLRRREPGAQPAAAPL